MDGRCIVVRRDKSRGVRAVFFLRSKADGHVSVWRQLGAVRSLLLGLDQEEIHPSLSFAGFLIVQFFLERCLPLTSSEGSLSAISRGWPVRPPASARLIAQSIHSTSRRSSAASSAVERLFVDCYLSTNSSLWYSINPCIRSISEGCL